ncbi:MAG: FdhF/YdeP family oxidoreductase [Dehalococcoidia bacterium]
MGWKPSTWASLIPNGLGQVKPNHYLDMLKTVWQNKSQLPFAWRILQNGVCDGCALGTTGMRDFTMKGVHLCTVRLNLLQLNTMGGLDPDLLGDVAGLRSKTSAQLRELGRLPYPMVRRRGEPGFRRVSWDEALALLADRIRETDPHRMAFYLTSRGITNEVYYVAQKVARFLGTNNVDNSSRICHAPSTVALKDTLGVAASTCSYTDWIGTDLLILIGSDVPNNQPVTTKYMYYAKQKGTRILVVNPYREPGMERYWVPSVLESALFGTRLADDFFQVHTGGDIAFINGVLKHLMEHGWMDQAFIEDHTAGFDQLKARLAEQSWETLEGYSGASRDEMMRFAQLFGQAKSAVIVWSMGITQHRFGVENVKALVNLALSRGMVGREKCGLMAIRGHSGVQGGAEMGTVPWQYPGGDSVGPESAERLERLWRFPVPQWRGLSAVDMIDAAHRGDLAVLYSLGGNFLETLPEPEYVREALERVPLRVHQDIVLTSQMLLDPADTVVLLPARTRYEQPGGGTETSTERRIYFSPEIPGRRVGESRSEWEILMELAERVRPDQRSLIHFDDAQAVRDEIAKVVPLYAGIEDLKKKGDAIQWGGVRLCEGGNFGTPDGRAHFTPLSPPETDIPPGWYLLSTRRGRQFNSMVQARRDPLTGAVRDDVLMSRQDADDLGVEEGGRALLRSKVGEFNGRCKIVPIKVRNLQVHWPEGSGC